MILTGTGKVVIDHCKILGNKQLSTLGVLIINCDVLVKNSQISDHTLGGIQIKSGKNQDIQITHCIINRNGNSGVLCLGLEGKPRIIHSSIR